MILKYYLSQATRVYKLLFIFFVELLILNPVVCLAKQDLQNIKGEHFIVYYSNDRQFAKEVLRKAEFYYREIANELGYGRHSEFWIWEKRVKVFIFPNRQAFLDAVDTDSWSEGVADYTQKKIISYAWSKGFLDALLPHEIAHLIFRDYVGFKGQVSLWLDEGVAQWMEPEKRSESFWIMAQIIDENKVIPLKRLTEMELKGNEDSETIYIFYVEAVSLVGFLIREYGSKQFVAFCRQLRDGKRLETALSFAYPVQIRSLEELEQKWLAYVKKEVMR